MNGQFRTMIAMLAAVLLGSGAVFAANDSQAIKQLMGDNFQNVHKILNELITSNYATLPRDVDVIRRHAEALVKSPPAAIKTEDDRVLFVSYATNLRTTASALIAVTEELARRDQQRQPAEELKIDYLRPVAALHFGVLIANCVLCHNQFRRVIVPLK
jgi:cytochrome c556